MVLVYIANLLIIAQEVINLNAPILLWCATKLCFCQSVGRGIPGVSNHYSMASLLLRCKLLINTTALVDKHIYCSTWANDFPVNKNNGISGPSTFGANSVTLCMLHARLY